MPPDDVLKTGTCAKLSGVVNLRLNKPLRLKQGKNSLHLMPRLRGILIQEESCLRFKWHFARNIAVRQFGLRSHVKATVDALRAPAEHCR